MSETISGRVDTRAKIVEVAARLLQEQGTAAVTTRSVAHGAGVQAPTIYRLFGDKNGLLEAVAEHVMAGLVAVKAAVVEAASVDGVDPLVDLRAGWQSQLEFGVANPDLFRLLSDPDRAQSSSAVRSGRRVLEARVHRVAETGRLRVSEERAVGLIQAAGTGAVLMLLATPAEQRDLGLADELYEAVLGQILTDAPEQGDGGAIATVIAFRAIAPRLDALNDAERQLLVDWLDRAIGSGLDRRAGA
ncbi:TetR/AcrR family transcriptional regulator [Herbiconiux ginsengi]|uniref:Transcriptional regulator, TetR family n=1 Tax=Herbiconiux ginsengi TaxID=381665 RepID=A0A1H3PDM3_9MICO|nr:TetR/AcrR family transcriptional regulator [Herbiconiux ginsengi]SDY99254.1 transcriptional regulator, TetR family [Herbiconiux ginsengi]